MKSTYEVYDLTTRVVEVEAEDRENAFRQVAEDVGADKGYGGVDSIDFRGTTLMGATAYRVKWENGMTDTGSALEVHDRRMANLSVDDYRGILAKHERGVHVPLEELPEEVQEMNENPPPSVVKVKEEMKKATPERLTTAQYEAALKEGKFERGRSMTVDEVAEVVGPEFKEMNVNPPPAVVKVTEAMTDKSAVAKGRTTHRADPKRPGFNMCGEKSYPDTTVDSIKDATCYYCKLAWDRNPGGHTAGEHLSLDMFADLLKDSKFEKGKSVPVAKLPEELQDNVEDPPPSVVKVKEEMKTAAAGYSLSLGTHGEPKVDGIWDPEGAAMILSEILGDKPWGDVDWSRGRPQFVTFRGKQTTWGELFDNVSVLKPHRLKRVRKDFGDNWIYYADVAPVAKPDDVSDSAWSRIACACNGGSTEATDDKEEGTPKTAAPRVSKEDWEKALAIDTKMLETYRGYLRDLEAGKPVENATVEGTKECIKGLEEVIANKKVLIAQMDKSGKTAGSGLYGSNKDVEKVCLSAGRKLQASTRKIAKEIYGKDAETPAFLQEHAKRAKCKAAKLLVGAMKDLGPKVATVRTASPSKTGLYGYKEKTARIALEACGALTHQAGLIAGDLHTRRASQYGQVTAFLRDHCKTGKCAYSALLLDGYPSDPGAVVATGERKASEWYRENFVMGDPTGGVTASEILAWDREAAEFLGGMGDTPEDEETND